MQFARLFQMTGTGTVKLNVPSSVLIFDMNCNYLNYNKDNLAYSG